MPSPRRFMCLWFPRLPVDRIRRAEPVVSSDAGAELMAVFHETGQMQVIAGLSPEAEAKGLQLGQPLRDALAMVPDLQTRSGNPQKDAAFLKALSRWAEKFSPWTSVDAPAGLKIDITGCAHLFGGDEGLAEAVEMDCADLGLSVRIGIADSVGAAWALARFAGRSSQPIRSGDAIDQEARATRSRAAKRRHWERGGAAPRINVPEAGAARIAALGKTRAAIGKLPVSALRISQEMSTSLARLGLRRIEDLFGISRATLTRRFGQELALRLDQALGTQPEPVAVARATPHFGARMSFPEPIGLETDILAALDRLLEPFCTRLKEASQGARKVQMQLFRTDDTAIVVDVTLARPTQSPERIRPLLAMKLGDVDAGFGIDMVRLEAVQTEPIQHRQHVGHAGARAAVSERLSGDTRLDDLIGKLGARIGLEEITYRHPADSNIPEKTAKPIAAAWAEPCFDWARPATPRPLVIFAPELVGAPDQPAPPARFRWRGRDLALVQALGPERISPEWWLDEPAWRTGVRDYWRVDVETGERLWLYYAHGGMMTGGWFCAGVFA